MARGAITAQCKTCHKVFYDEHWLFGGMAITLPHVNQTMCPVCKKTEKAQEKTAAKKQGVA